MTDAGEEYWRLFVQWTTAPKEEDRREAGSRIADASLTTTKDDRWEMLGRMYELITKRK